MQLDYRLDLWPWEAELERVRNGLAVTRHLIGQVDELVAGRVDVGLTGALGSASREDPAWLQGPPAQCLESACRAQMQGRPLLSLSNEVTVRQARSFRMALLAQWGAEPRLSRAAVMAASTATLSREAWRLYGDANFKLAAVSDTQWRQVTSLSIDLIRSTGLLETWGAERYAQSHAAFYQLCRRIVEQHGGRLDDPQGDDGMMAYFGLLQGQEEAAAQAVLAGWTLLQSVTDLGFGARIGVATGRVAVSAGQPYGMEVHLAARLQRIAPPNGMIISDHTQLLLGPGAECERLPMPVQLEGIREPQLAYKVVGLPAPLDAQRQRLGRGHFVGRERELASLNAAWDWVRQHRRAKYLCVLGEAGIGKSRLLQEFELALGDDDTLPAPVRITGHSQTQSSAFSALATGLKRPDFLDIAKLLERSTTAGEERPVHERQREREALIEGLVSGLLEHARRSPLCCIVDDAQWLDPSTAELVDRLQVRAQHVPLFLVVSKRDEGRSVDPAPQPSDTISVVSLDLDASMRLIGALAASASMSPELRQLIARRAGGIPLFLEEFVRMVEGIERNPKDQLQSIPPTLEDPLVARLDALGAARPLAQLAAVLGNEFEASLWQAVLAEPDEWIQHAQATQAWPRLLGSGLLHSQDAGETRYRFKHALLRDAAYESLWVLDRKRLHAVVARVLDRFPHESLADLELLAHHLDAAGELVTAFSTLALAARQAASVAANREALALSDRALEMQTKLQDTAATRQQALQLHLLQAARHMVLDGYGAASVESAYLRAAALCGDAQDLTMRTRVELGLEACYAMRGDLTRSRALADAAVQNTPWDANLRLALQARWAWVNVTFHQGELLPALDMAQQCLERYEPSLHQPRAAQDPAIMCLSYTAWGLFERGCAGQARKSVEHLLELAQTLKHPFSHAVAFGFAASVTLFCGDHPQALVYADEALRRCTASAFKAWLAHAKIMRGRLRAELGEPRAGLAEMEQGYRLWTDTGARITCATYLAFQAEVCLQLDEPGEALRRISQAQEIADRHGEHYHEAELLRLQGWSHWLLRSGPGDAEAAQSLLGEALALARAQGKLGFALRSALALGRTWSTQGESARAIPLLDEALKAVPDHNETLDARLARAALRDWKELDR